MWDVASRTEFTELSQELVVLFRRGVDAPMPESRFQELARRAFAYQVRSNPAYGAYAAARGFTGEDVASWEEIPAVPTAAFRELALVSGDVASARTVFRTSGTTKGARRRGEHHILDARLYHESLVPSFLAHVLPERTRMRMAALVSSPEEVPDSSLSHMVGEVMRRFGSSGSGFFVDRARGLRGEALLRTLGDVEDEAEPLLLLGTAFSFVHLLDEMSRSGVRYALPLGSRIMETGGFKGRSRVVHRAELYESLSDRLGVPEARIVSEYGMTELLSQFYEPVLRGGGRHHVSPPWVRTRVLDPASLDPVPRGEVGVLCHFDLANLGSVCAVLTEDLGVEDADGFRLLGREEGSEPRGCSMALDELLSLTRP